MNAEYFARCELNAKLGGEGNPDDGFTLPKGWFWETDSEAREANTSVRAHLTDQSIAVAWENDEATYLHLDAAASLLLRAVYPVGERVKP